MIPLNFDNTENAFKYKTTKALRHAQAMFAMMANGTITKVGINLTNWAFKLGLPVKGIMKSTLYKQFCGGETLEEISETTKVLEKYGVDVCLDYGVEGAEDEKEFDKAVEAFLKTIEFASTTKNIPFIPLKVTGFSFGSLLEKVSNKEELTSEDKKSWDRVKKRIDTICNYVYKNNLSMLIDAEESWYQQAVDDLTDEMMERYNKERACVFNTFQLYRHDRLEFLKKSHKKAQEKGYILGVKIVRGAYMEKERSRAEEMGYPSPIQPNKEATDRDYNLAIDYCFEHLADISLFVGTHNEDSSMKAAMLMDEKKMNHMDHRVHFSQLFGMSDNITFNLSAAGYNASKYLPYGPVQEVIPYLMRRAQENTSVKGQTSRELLLINKELKRRKSSK